LTSPEHLRTFLISSIEVSDREPKTTVPVTEGTLSELARESVEGRPTTQMDPAEMRALVGEAVPPIDDLGARKVPDVTDAGMRPLTKPPPLAEGTGAPATRAPSSGDVVVLAREDRKTQKARARELRAARDQAEAAGLTATPTASPTSTAPTASTTWVLLAIVSGVAILAVIGWLR
jgi:hypothetical protein